MKVGESLLVCEMKSVGAAYSLMQEMRPELHDTIELIPNSDGAVLMVSGKMDDLLQLLRKANDIFSSRFIENLTPAVIESYLGLQNPPLGERFMLFESRQVGDVFEAACRMESQGLTPFDLRILRGSGLRAYVMGSGPAGAAISTDGISGQLTQIENPNPVLKSYFEISAQK